LAAADLLQQRVATASDGDPGDHRRALDRCALEDKHAAVARHCRAGRPVVKDADDLMVFVVPHAGTQPVARASFALVRPDGALRLGVADRRGALFERRCPRGSVQLAVPAPLAQ
jgi:hypothetical protein